MFEVDTSKYEVSKLAKKANFGCGPLTLLTVQDRKMMQVDRDLSDWLMIDLYIKERGIENWDIETLEEIPFTHLDEIYTSHALEHISHQRVMTVLALWHRKLAESGKITIVVPDLFYAFKQLKALENDQVPEKYYNEYFGLKSPLTIIYGTHSQPGEHHLGGFTPALLRYALEKTGYHNIDIDVFYDEHSMDSIVAKATK